LLHYAAYGDRENRQPMPLFDPSYYRQHAKGQGKRVNALLHYALVGRYLGLSPSPWFDVTYYLAHNKDVARAGLDPLLHYLQFGGVEGRSPSASFDGTYYLRSNPDIAEARVNPLIHYLSFGRLEGRAVQLPSVASEWNASDGAVPLATLPKDEEWASIEVRPALHAADIDVIVPVYKGRAETLRCLFSVLASKNITPYELVVINDASPDHELTADLKQLAARYRFTLLDNETNCGFVHTVNLGMALHGDRDVVLLNSDAEVYGDWLDRLYRASRRHHRTGKVTTLSNNATL